MNSTQPIGASDVYLVQQLWTQAQGKKKGESKELLTEAVERLTGQTLGWKQVSRVAQEIVEQGTEWSGSNSAAFASSGKQDVRNAEASGGGGSSEALMREQAEASLRKMVSTAADEAPAKYTDTIEVKVDKNEVSYFKDRMHRLAESHGASVRVVDERWPVSFNATLTLLYYDAPEEFANLMSELGTSTAKGARVQSENPATNQSGAKTWRVGKDVVSRFKTELERMGDDLGADVTILKEKWPLGFSAWVTFSYSNATEAFTTALEAMSSRFRSR